MVLRRGSLRLLSWGALLIAAEEGCSDGICSSAESWMADLDTGTFSSRGFVLLRGFASVQEIAALQQGAADLIELWDPASSHQLRMGLSLRAEDRQKTDHSFLLDSATNSSVFPEPSAVDPDTGQLRTGLTKRQAVRKLAHGLHLQPGPFQDFVFSAKLARVAEALGYSSAVIVQSLYRVAPPLAAGVDLHQDSTTLYTEPPSVMGFWLALEEADEDNGCLWLRPGSHRGQLRERLVRKLAESDGDDAFIRNASRVVLDFKQLSPNLPPVEWDAFTPIRAKPGDLLVMHGLMEHFSNAGRDPLRGRESFQVHVVDAQSTWSSDNWLQYPSHMRFARLAQPESSFD